MDSILDTIVCYHTTIEWFITIYYYMVINLHWLLIILSPQ